MKKCKGKYCNEKARDDKDYCPICDVFIISLRQWGNHEKTNCNICV